MSMAMKMERRLLLIITFVQFCSGKLILQSWPKTNDVLYAVEKTGQTLLTCIVDSDRPFQLKWYKDGKEISKAPPPWPFKHADGKGLTLVQFPYIFGRSKGEYECRASNGHDPDVSNKVKFVPAKKSELPSGFPNITKSPADANYDNTQYIGSNLTFECDASGDGIEFRWFFRRVPVQLVSPKAKKGQQLKLTTSITNGGRNLTIFNLGKVTLSHIECYVANSVGMNLAGRFQLNSIPAIKPTLPPRVPVIIVHPKNVSVGGPEQWINFNCEASGQPPPHYHWLHDGEIVKAGHPHGRVSVVAMRTGNLTCIAYNDVGQAKTTTYLYVKPLPYEADAITIKDKGTRHFTVILQPNYREAQWHKHIPITHAIIDFRPFVRGLPKDGPSNSTKIAVTGKPPWHYRFANLDPWTYIDVRVRFLNKYGTGNVSEWVPGHSEWGRLVDPVRNLHNNATSNQSFVLTWQNPEKTNGPLQRYEVYFTTRPGALLKHWFQFAVPRIEQSFSYNWHGKRKILHIAPVIYWKVRLIGFVNEGPFSETKVFRVFPGAPGNVSDLKLKTIDARSMQVTWVPTKEVGNGIIGHKVLYNRQDKPAVERRWKVIELTDPDVLTVKLTGLSPNRAYEVKVYPRSKSSIGVPSNVAVSKTLPDSPTASPQNVRGEAKHSQTIKIRWDPPPDEHQNSPITAYKLFYTQKLERKPYFKDLGKDDRHVELQGLGKYKKYKIWMVAYNAIGEGPPSKSIEVFTSEKVPEGAPLAVQAEAMNDTTIAVTWLPPSSVRQNGRIIGYKVYYTDWPNCRKGLNDKLEEFTVNGANARDAVFRRFVNPNSHYKVLVAALTSAGVGVKSNPLCIKTPLKRPTAPLVDVQLDKTVNYVTMKWWPPPGDIKGYKIEYGKTLRKFDMLTDIKNKEVGKDVRQSLFDDLDSGVYYCFKLYALLNKGKGWTTPSIQWIKTSDGVPTGPPLYFNGVTESSSTIKLNWDEPNPWLRNGLIIGYDIWYRVTDAIQWSKAVYNLKGEEDSIVFLLTDLKSNSRYEIKVRARTMVGPGTDSNVVYVKTNKEVLPVVNKLGVMEISTTTAYIHWSDPLNANKFKDFVFKYNIIYSFVKTYRLADGKPQVDSTNETVTILSKQYELEDLQPGTTYTVKVFVDLSEAGIGDPVEIKFTTISEKPKSVISPQIDANKEMNNQIPITIPAVSEVYGPINHCVLFVINLRQSSVITRYVKKMKFYNDISGGKRRRRRRYVNDVNNTYVPEYHIAGFFENKELPTVFNLGDGTSRNQIINSRLVEGSYYTTFIRAYVRQGSNNYVYTDSPFSQPIKYTPTQSSSQKQGTKGEQAGGSMVPIIAGAVGVLVLLIVVIVIVYFMRKRRQSGSERDRLLSKKRKGSTDPTEIHRLQANTPGMIQHPPIPVHALAIHVKMLRENNSTKHLCEFESIDPGERPPSEASLLPQNKMKNRYPNVLAFDYTRVKLDHTGVLCSDYINANYVDGYCKEKAYISTQGPLKATIEDFWRMCWEQNVQTIVMMTKVEERGRNKCERYWPSEGSQVYGTVKVMLKDTRSFCHYCVRTFEVSSTVCNDTRILKQFQYIQWPDPGVPIHFGPVLSFIRRVRAFDPPGCGPTVVHCSAGVGRSACYIAIDAMLERLKHDSMIDIYGYVTMMRTQRNFMVQTDEQYIFIYDVLVEAIEHGLTEIASSDLAVVFKQLAELRADGGEPQMEVQFKSLSFSAYATYDQNLCTNAHLDLNEGKNRCRTIVPFDHNRVVLQQIRNQQGSDYINASHIDGFYQKNAYIATQAPFEETVADFWRMIMEQDSSIIVMVTNLEDRGKEESFQYWPSTKTMRHYYYVIDPQQEKRFANFVVREFKITDARDSTSRLVRHYQYLNWAASSAPSSSEGIVELIGQVQKAYTKSENKGPIVIHGSTGAGRTGVFIGLSIALESLRSERVVDIYQIVKTLRHERPYMVQTNEQYEYCYRVAADFLKNFDLIV